MRTRRIFSPEFKARVVLEIISGARSQSDICREHNIKPQLLSQWRARLLQKAPEIFKDSRKNNPDQSRIEELERVLGRKTLELEIAKKASSILQAHLNRNGK